MPRERVPLDVHALKGTEPKYAPEGTSVPAGRPKFPKGISGEARKAFKRLVAMLEERRHLTNADGELLNIYSRAFDRHQRAIAKLEEEGEVRKYVRLDSNGQPHEQEKPNLWLKVAQDAERTMLACLDRLGLTPMSRSKVRPVENSQPKELVPGSVAWILQQAKEEKEATELLENLPTDEELLV